MFGIGSTELLVILVVALIVLGPKSLASVSRSLGKAMGEFRRVSTEFQRTINLEAAEDDARLSAKKKAESAGAKAETVHAPEQADSPLAQAIAKAKAEAARSDGKSGGDTGHAS